MTKLDSLIAYYTAFKNNAGFRLTLSSFIQKLGLFLISWLAIRLLEKEVYGQLAYVSSVIGIVTYFGGFGMNHGLLRFGALSQSAVQKSNIDRLAFSRGLVYSFWLTLAIMLVSPFISKGSWSIQLFMMAMAVRVATLFLQQYQFTSFRIYLRNAKMAEYEIFGTIIYVLLALPLLYFFAEWGYVFALVLAPGINFFWYRTKGLLPKWKWSFSGTGLKPKSFWSYSLTNCVASVSSQLLFMVDVLFVSNMLGDEAAAEYRVATIIPLNIFVIPLIFMKTDLTVLIQRARDRSYLIDYFRNYLFLFLVFSLAVMLGAYFLGDFILSIFGEKYQPFTIFMILTFGSLIAVLFRIPFGNFIAGMGKPHINILIALVSSFLAVVCNWIFIPLYGLEGAAWATVLGLSLSGALCFGYFVFYVSRLPKKATSNEGE